MSMGSVRHGNTTRIAITLPCSMMGKFGSIFKLPHGESRWMVCNGWKSYRRHSPGCRRVVSMSSQTEIDSPGIEECGGGESKNGVSESLVGALEVDGQESSGVVPVPTSQTKAVGEDDEVSKLRSLWEDFRVPFDYFTPIFIAGGVSAAVGFIQSFTSSPSLAAFSMDNLLEFQLPIQSAIFGAVFLQAIAGWGFALAAIAGVSTLGPGVTVQQAQAIVAMIAVPVDAGMFLPYLREKKFDGNVVDRWVVGAVLGTPAGVLALKYVDEKSALFCLGSLLLAYCTYASYDIIRCYHDDFQARLLADDSTSPDATSIPVCKITPSKYPALGTWASGVFAGLLGGAFDAPGPPLVVFADLTGMANSPELTRANFLAYFALDAQLVAITDFLDGRFNADFVWPSALLAIPTMLVANATGKWFIHVQPKTWGHCLRPFSPIRSVRCWNTRARLDPEGHSSLVDTASDKLEPGEFKERIPVFVQSGRSPMFDNHLLNEVGAAVNLIESEEERSLMKARCSDEQEFCAQQFVTTRVAGASFHQDALETLATGELVIFEKEPENEYDRDAVRIVCLDGRLLGYVPKDETHLFKNMLATTFGRVLSTGRNDAGFCGAFIQSMPDRQYLCLIAMPSSIREARHFWRYLTPLRQSRIQDDEVMNGNLSSVRRCCVTGTRFPSDVETKELWSIDHIAHNLVFKGVNRLWHPLGVLEDKPFQSWDVNDFALLAGANWWTMSEAKAYVNLCLRREAELNGVEHLWRINLDWFLKPRCRVPKRYMEMWSEHLGTS